ASNGMVEAVLLPNAVRFALEHVESAVLSIGELFVPEGNGPGSPENVVERIEHVLAGWGVATRLRDAGIPRDALQVITEHARDDWSLQRLPRAISAPQLLEFVNQAW